MDEQGLDADFTEHEIYCALRLQVPDAEARSQASDFARAYVSGMDWSTSDAMLLYLSVGSESGRARVERIRRSVQLQLRTAWVARERQRNPTASEDEVTQAWARSAEAAEREWDERVAGLRRELGEQGLLPGDSEGE